MTPRVVAERDQWRRNAPLIIGSMNKSSALRFALDVQTVDFRRAGTTA